MTKIYEIVEVDTKNNQVILKDEKGNEVLVFYFLIVDNKMNPFKEVKTGWYVTESQETGFFVVIQPE